MNNERSFLKYKRYYTYIEPFFKAPILRTYTTLVLSFLTVSFFIVFAIRPTIKTIVSLNKQIGDGKFTDQKLQEKINALSMAQAEYNQVSGDLPVILASLPDNPSVAPFVKTLESVASSSGVSVNSFQLSNVDLLDFPSSRGKKVALGEIGFTMVVSSPYKNLLSFLEFIRKVQRLIIIEKIAIGVSREKESKSALQLNLTGKMYYYK